MKIIKTQFGIIKFKPQVIYWGVKTINKEVAARNLSDLKAILDGEGIKFMLIAGTLLGAVREHDFISHDEDIDLAFLEEDKQAVLDVLPKVLEIGFDIARYDNRGLLSVIRNGEYIDLYFFKPKEGEYGIRTCSGWLILEKFLTRYGQLDFKGEVYSVPLDYIGYLQCEYGENWKTPIKWFDYKMPSWKQRLFAFREHLKELAPSCVLEMIYKFKEPRFEMRYRNNINQYLSNGGSID